MDNWYYALNGAQVGPVSQAALQQLLASGQVPPDSLVWCTGMAEWVPASTLPQLAANPAPVMNQPAMNQPVIGYGVGASAYVNPDINNIYAGFWIRFGASLIDFIITSVAAQIVGTIEGGIIGATGSHGNVALAAAGVGGATGLLISWLYFAFMHSSPRQASVGMLVVGTRVTDLNGNQLSFGRASGRYFASLLTAITTCLFGIGYLMMLWTPRKQTLHDLIAGTVVLLKNPPSGVGSIQ